MIYFVLQPPRPPPLVKVGYSACVTARLSSMQVGNASGLELLGWLPGGRAEEAEYHAALSRWRVRGEWYALPARVLDQIVAACREYEGYTLADGLERSLRAIGCTHVF